MPIPDTTVKQDPNQKQRVRFPFQPIGDDGKSAPVDGNIVIEFDDPTQPVTAGNADPLNPTVSAPVDFFGDVSGSCVGDADLGAGVERLVERFKITYVHPKATNLGAMTPVVEPEI